MHCPTRDSRERPKGRAPTPDAPRRGRRAGWRRCRRRRRPGAAGQVIDAAPTPVRFFTSAATGRQRRRLRRLERAPGVLEPGTYPTQSGRGARAHRRPKPRRLGWVGRRGRLLRPPLKIRPARWNRRDPRRTPPRLGIWAAIQGPGGFPAGPERARALPAARSSKLPPPPTTHVAPPLKIRPGRWKTARIRAEPAQTGGSGRIFRVRGGFPADANGLASPSRRPYLPLRHDRRRRRRQPGADRRNQRHRPLGHRGMVSDGLTPNVVWPCAVPGAARPPAGGPQGGLPRRRDDRAARQKHHPQRMRQLQPGPSAGSCCGSRANQNGLDPRQAGENVPGRNRRRTCGRPRRT